MPTRSYATFRLLLVLLLITFGLNCEVDAFVVSPRTLATSRRQRIGGLAPVHAIPGFDVNGPVRLLFDATSSSSKNGGVADPSVVYDEVKSTALQFATSAVLGVVFLFFICVGGAIVLGQLIAKGFVEILEREYPEKLMAYREEKDENFGVESEVMDYDTDIFGAAFANDPDFAVEVFLRVVINLLPFVGEKEKKQLELDITTDLPDVPDDGSKVRKEFLDFARVFKKGVAKGVADSHEKRESDSEEYDKR